MYRFLLTPRWLGGLAMAAVLAAVCVLLGTWQWDRREEARARVAPVLANYDRETVPLRAVLEGELADGSLDRGAEWTPVLATGTYRAEETLLVRNRSLAGRPGYQVLVPLSLSDGGTFVVNRGWLPTGATGRGPDTVPPPPGGEVEVRARLRAPEPPGVREAPAGQLHTVDTARVAAVLGRSDLVLGAYGVLADEKPSASPNPVPLPRPALDEGPHLSYSLQWFVFAVGIFVGYGVLARRTAADLRHQGVGVPAPRPQRRRRSVDEEAEDAVLDRVDRR